jgi:hypothetical protein
VPACPRCLTGGSRLSAPARACSLSLSLSLLCGADLSAPFLSYARALSLCLADPTRQPPQPSLTSRPHSPAMDAPTTARSLAMFSSLRPFRSPHTTCPLPLLICSLNRALPPPLSPYACDQPSSTAAHRGSPPFHDSRCARITPVPSVSSAASPAARDTL